MITHGTKINKLFRTGKNPQVKIIRGCYLVLPSGDRHWLGESRYPAAKALDKACDKYLSDETGWSYWIDFCYGYDVHGNLAWMNTDQTDMLLDMVEQY